jgi:RHS repeat-associated protein
VSQRRLGISRYFLFDPLGTIARLTNGNGAVTDVYLFNAFGGVLLDGTTPNPFRFIGRLGYYVDLDIKVYYIRRRSLSPLLARFMSADPEGMFGVEAELYQYVNNNAVNAADPTGLGVLNFGKETACAGTDCVYTGDVQGIITEDNPNADPANLCNDPCKKAIVKVHEAQHKINMKPCCDKMVKCIKKARAAKDAQAEKVCRDAWGRWKEWNRYCLEELAAVETCKEAKTLAGRLLADAMSGICPSPTCYEVVLEELDKACDNANPDADTSACPFKRDGTMNDKVARTSGNNPNCTKQLKAP